MTAFGTSLAYLSFIGIVFALGIRLLLPLFAKAFPYLDVTNAPGPQRILRRIAVVAGALGLAAGVALLITWLAVGHLTIQWG